MRKKLRIAAAICGILGAIGGSAATADAYMTSSSGFKNLSATYSVYVPGVGYYVCTRSSTGAYYCHR